MKFTEEHYDKYIGLVLYICKRHSKLSFVDHYDLIQAGLLGLAEGLKCYDKKKGKESAWVFRFIRSSIIKARYNKGKEYKEINGYEPSLEGDEDNMDENSPDNLIIDSENKTDNDKRYNDVYKILRSNIHYLTKDNNLNRKLYIDYIFKKTKVRDLAVKYDLTKCAIWHRIKKVSILIKKEYLKKENKHE